MAPILQVFVVGCSAAVVAIATRAFRVADSESARESWRLLLLRGWSNAKDHPILPGGP